MKTGRFMLAMDTMTIDPPFREQLRRANLSSVPQVLACPGDHLAAWSRSTDSVRCECSNGGTSIYIKRYHYPRWKGRFQAMFRGTFFKLSRAHSEYRALTLMRRLGIQAVRPIAFGERRIFHFLRSCFLITETVPDALSLSTFIQTFGEHRLSAKAREARREILTSLARQIRHMHDAGFVHRDLFWRNVLIRVMPDDRFEFYFLDASVGKRIRLAQRRQESIVRDIAAMGTLAPHFCSKADQLRFLLAYLGKKKLTPEDHKWLIRVQARADFLRDSELRRLECGEVFDRTIRKMKTPTTKHA